MKHENVDAHMMDLHRRIALVLRKEPGLVHYLAKQLRSKMATARSSEKAKRQSLGMVCHFDSLAASRRN
jgi:hypothetical protein